METAEFILDAAFVLWVMAVGFAGLWWMMTDRGHGFWAGAALTMLCGLTIRSIAATDKLDRILQSCGLS